MNEAGGMVKLAKKCFYDCACMYKSSHQNNLKWKKGQALKKKKKRISRYNTEQIHKLLFVPGVCMSL